MEPRIYLYRITFEGRPEWYLGIHKEKKFDEYYMGSPCTHKEFWKLHTPIKEILETFDNSEKGWKTANMREQELISPHLNDPLCLNENCGSVTSLEVRSNTMKRLNKLWWSDEKHRAMLSKARKLQWQNPEYKEFMLKRASEANLKRYAYGAERERMSNTMTEKWKDPEFRDKMRSLNSSHRLSDETIKERFEKVKTAGIDLSKYGWVQKVSNLWGVSHTQVKRVFKKHWKGEPPYSRKLSTKALLAP